MPTAHTCSACLVHCMDYRIQETLERLAGVLNLTRGDYDRVGIAGGAGNHEQSRIHLELSTDLHDARMLILTAHEDCGAGVMRGDLVTALRRTREQYVDRHVRAFWVKLDGTWEELF